MRSKIFIPAAALAAIFLFAAAAVLLWPKGPGPALEDAAAPVPTAEPLISETASLAPPPPPPPIAAPAPPAPASKGRVSGRVVTVEGLPADGAEVRAAGQGRVGPAATAIPAATADADGRFAFDGLPIDGYAVTARADGGIGYGQTILYDHAPHGEMTIVLVAGGAIAGMVVADGAPVAGARIAAMQHNGGNLSRGERAAYQQESGEDGAFRFDAMAMDHWSFYVHAPGFAPVSTESIAAGTEDLLVTLTPGAVIKGVVRNAADGAPMAGVTVQAARANYPVDGDRATSGGDGAFRFDALAVDDYVVNIADDALALRDGPVTIAVAADANAPVELWVVDGGVVRGRVIDGATGAAVGGVRVVARPGDDERLERTSPPSDGSGGFTIAGLSAGTYRLSVGRVAGFKYAGSDRGFPTVQAVPGETLDGVEIVLDGGIRVSGVAQFADGSPASGAEIRGRGRYWWDQTFAGEDGAFVLAGLEEPDTITIAATVEEATNSHTGPFDVPAEGLHGLTVTLDLAKDGHIAGIVVDERGAPLAAKVAALQEGRPMPSSPPIFTAGPDGRFLLANLAAGDWRITATYGTTEPVELEQVTLAPGQEIQDLRLVLTVGERKPIRGRVTNEAGKPVRASVTANEMRAEPGRSSLGPGSYVRADPDGQFETAALPVGVYQLTVRSEGYQTQIIEGVDAGRDDVDVVLEAGLHVAGRVVGQNGRPVTAYDIVALSMSQPSASGSHAYQHVADSEGRFFLPVTGERGANYVCVRAAGFRPECFLLNPAVYTESVDDLVVTLSPGGARLTGIAMDATGAPAANAQVYLGANARGEPAARTGGDGRFRVDPVSEDVTLVIVRGLTGIGRAAVLLEEGRETEVAVTIEAFAGLEGVVIADGQPWAGVPVRFSPVEGVPIGVTTDAAGRYRFPNVPPGPGTVEAPSAAIGGRPIELDVDLTPGAVSQVDIDAG